MNTDALREIKNTMSRFLSLFLLSALAVAFLMLVALHGRHLAALDVNDPVGHGGEGGVVGNDHHGHPLFPASVLKELQDQYTADDYFDRTGLMDARVLSTLGLTEEDIEALATAPGVDIQMDGVTNGNLRLFQQSGFHHALPVVLRQASLIP